MYSVPPCVKTHSQHNPVPVSLCTNCPIAVTSSPSILAQICPQDSELLPDELLEPELLLPEVPLD
jgi:hypothetical protein